MYITNSDCTIKENNYTINVPKGTRVAPITGGGGEISYAVNCSNVSNQRNPHDRMYRYLCVPNEIVIQNKS